MVWGILVDVEGSGPTPFNINLDTGLILQNGAELGHSNFFYYGGETITRPGFLAEPGPGALNNVSEAMDPYSNPLVSAGAPFAIVWFEPGIALNSEISPSASYGLLSNPGFLLPADGSDQHPLHPLFSGPDPVRPADRTVTVSLPADTSFSVAEVDPGGGDPITRHLAYTFTANVATLAATTVSLEQSTTLLPGSWTPLAASPEVVQDNGATQLLRIFDPDPIGTDPKRFIRLRLEP